MTKARDLAGFSTGSITNTTADGLILKGDGSSTDVIIKNGANATVASVADGTVNIAAAGSITATGAVTRALTRGSIDVGNSSGVSAPLAKGTSGYVLTAGANDLSWVEAGSGGIEFISTSGAISNAGSVVFTGFDDSKYNNYFFMFNNVLCASADTLYCQTSIDNGSNFATTNGDYHRTSNADATGMLVAENQQPGNPTTYGVSGRFELYQPTDADNYTYSATYVLKMDNLLRILPAAVQTTLNYQNSARIAEEDNDAVRFLYIGGSNIASGEIAMYGIKKA